MLRPQARQSASLALAQFPGQILPRKEYVERFASIFLQNECGGLDAASDRAFQCGRVVTGGIIARKIAVFQHGRLLRARQSRCATESGSFFRDGFYP